MSRKIYTAGHAGNAAILKKPANFAFWQKKTLFAYPLFVLVIWRAGIDPVNQNKDLIIG